MRIAYLSEGNNVYDRRFLEKMVKRGHQPTLISYNPGELVQVDGVEKLHYDFDAIPRFKMFHLFQVALHLRQVLKRIEPDILHTGFIRWHGIVGALTGFHPALSMPWGSDILIMPWGSRSLKWYTRFTLRQADRITCDCEHVKSKIIELSGCPPEKIEIFPWGIDLNTFKPQEGASRIRAKLGWERNKVLIMTRSMARSLYGHTHFIEALPAIVQAEPTTRVVFLGSGELVPVLRQRLIDLGLESHVHFAGFLNEPDVTEYLNAADIYISASLSDGTSCSLLEAMACRLPVVVTDLPAIREWVKDGENGYLVPTENSTALAERTITLLGDRSLRKEMGARNLEIAREMADWEKNFDILENIYSQLAGRPKRK